MAQDAQMSSQREEDCEKDREVSSSFQSHCGQQRIEYLASNFEQQPETGKLLTFHPDNDADWKLWSVLGSIPPVPPQSGIPLEEPPKSNLQLWSVLQILNLIGSQERQEKKLNEVLEMLRIQQGSICSLDAKVDKAINKTERLDYLHDGTLTKSFVEMLNMGKMLQALAEVLAKSLEKGASPMVARQEPSSKRRKS